ncbi:MAG: hypothetical protein ACTSO7_03355 [Candidatus Heimdallarchaeota archaeon]
MTRYIPKIAPDYLPLTAHEFVRHFANLFSNKSYDLSIEYEKYTQIIGYSCRSLFEVCMMHYQKKDLVVATTPLHHTSFRNIMERYVKPENIHIIDLNKQYNGLGKIPELERCDLVVITHLFGQDMDLSKLTEFKKKHNCIVIEDRVQGGSLDLEFSHDVSDIAIYSMAMDKRPIALGGGFMYVKNKHKKDIEALTKIIDSLPEEKTSTRFKELLKKIPTILLYNSRSFLYSFISTLKLLNIFNKNIHLLNITKIYRKENPGFSRGNYLFKPSKGLLKSMYENFGKHKRVERLYTAKYEFFIQCLSPKLVSIFTPWYKANESLSSYNTLIIKEELVDELLEFCNYYNMSSLPNPTYKIFNHKYKNDSRYIKFNNGIAYVPSIINMNKREIIFLTNKLKEFYRKYY